MAKTNSEKNIRNKSLLREWLEAIIIAIILAMFIRTFIVQAFKIPSGSMYPTLKVGDRILVNKFIYGPKIRLFDFRLPGIKKPNRGDVIVFVYPKDEKRDFIKRLVATEGEIVQIKYGKIYINNKAVNDPLFARPYYNQGSYGQEGEKVAVPSGEYYVLGDNSESSQDSRYWGFVPEKNILGKAFLIYWPPNRIRIIK